MKKNSSTKSWQYNVATKEFFDDLTHSLSEKVFSQKVPIGFAGNEQYINYRTDYESEEERIKELENLLPEGGYMIDGGIYTGKGGYIMFVMALEKELKQILNEEARENKAGAD